MVHWPVNKIPFKGGCQTNTKWKGMVSHSSLVGAGSRTNTEWTVNYQENTSARKYREWVSLLGMTDPYDREHAAALVNSWNNPGTVSLIGSSFSFDSYLRAEKAFIFRNNGDISETFSFELEPNDKIINPVLKIKNWGDRDLTVKVNGEKANLQKALYENGDIIIWIQKEIFEKSTISVEAGDREFTGGIGLK